MRDFFVGGFSSASKKTQTLKPSKITGEARHFELSTCFYSSIACTVGLSRTGDEEQVVTEKSLQQLYDAFIAAMNDYTIDSRGDVGAW